MLKNREIPELPGVTATSTVPTERYFVSYAKNLTGFLNTAENVQPLVIGSEELSLFKLQ